MSIIIGYAGMTHLGLNYAVAGAGKGFDVVCYDKNPERIHSIIEPNLHEAREARSQKLHFTSDIQELKKCDIVYISPDVITDDNGQSDLSYIKSLIEDVIPVLNQDALIVILAQVPPGFTRSIDFPASRKFYQVETLIFGQALHRAEEPERFIVGSASGQLEHRLELYLKAFQCPILPMRYESAELCKIAINCCLVASIGVANSLGEICENIGADWSEIVPALKLDKRIGQHAYLKPGLGISGGNLERDLATVVNFASEHGTDKWVIQSLRNNSRHRRNWPLKMLFNNVLRDSPNARIAVWGLTYKENTHSLKNSPAVQLLDDIKQFDVVAYDPVIKDYPGTELANSAMDAATNADVLVIMTPWDDFKQQDVRELSKVMRKKVVIDPFAVLPAAEGFEYFTLGKQKLETEAVC